MNFYFTWVLATIMLMILDACWLPLAWKPFYKPVYDDIQGGLVKIRIGSAVFTWVLLGLVVALHQTHTMNPPVHPFWTGALSGFILYGVYNFTNHATLKHYTLRLSIIDTLWGSFALGVVSYLLSLRTNRLTIYRW